MGARPAAQVVIDVVEHVMNDSQDRSTSFGFRNSRAAYLIAVVVPAVVVLVSLFGAEPEPVEDTASSAAVDNLAYADPISPLPATVKVDPRKVHLGKDLFFDPRLSGTGDVSCASCHDITEGGDDGLPTSIGAGDREGQMNAPTVFNAAFNLAQFWDGRSPTLESQIDGPITNPDEMASSWPEIVDRLSADQSYRGRFHALYADGITPETVKDAIASFERTLITPNAPFDRYLQGDRDAIGPLEKEGYRLFSSLGCVSCHQGRNIGGNVYQGLGVVRPYFEGRTIERRDLGRYNVTGDEADRHLFKVPSLRNVALTAPYFHDGSIESLEDAVALMGYHQLGRVLSYDEIQAIVAFLGSLTGDMPS